MFIQFPKNRFWFFNIPNDIKNAYRQRDSIIPNPMISMTITLPDAPGFLATPSQALLSPRPCPILAPKAATPMANPAPIATIAFTFDAEAPSAPVSANAMGAKTNIIISASITIESFFISTSLFKFISSKSAISLLRLPWF
ncbi:hypothetical protein MBAV_006045 [Candidatus Magnetobacterium bavaricum]|uniref:Uncharacterized protein n=1 Tax=Candidatus Magnetobacterium bavaricum TaxID=29290 RepID=A0A0F3GM72_9BACT|nr:hypothetical protein MBAV_006045 [Candidatus Magnetobacterium bavaricum]